MSYTSRRYFAHVVSQPLPHLRVCRRRSASLPSRMQPSSRHLLLRGTLLIRAPFSVSARRHLPFSRRSAAIPCLYSRPLRDLVLLTSVVISFRNSTRTCHVAAAGQPLSPRGTGTLQDRTTQHHSGRTGRTGGAEEEVLHRSREREAPLYRGGGSRLRAGGRWRRGDRRVIAVVRSFSYSTHGATDPTNYRLHTVDCVMREDSKRKKSLSLTARPREGPVQRRLLES